MKRAIAGALICRLLNNEKHDMEKDIARINEIEVLYSNNYRRLFVLV